MPGQYIYGALSNIADTIERETERKRTEAQEAAALRKLITIYRPGLKDDAMTANLADLRGTSQAIHLQDLQQERESQQAERAAFTERAKQTTALSTAAAERAKRQDEQTGPFSQYLRNAMEFEEKPFLNAYLEAREKFPFGAEGAELHPGFARVLNEALEKQRANVRAPAPEMLKLGGMDVIWSPKGGQFQIDPGVAADYRMQQQERAIEARAIPKPAIPAGAKPVKIGAAEYFQDEHGNLFRATQANPLLQLLQPGGAGAGGTPGAPAPPPAALTPTLRFRKNPQTGKVEQY